MLHVYIRICYDYDIKQYEYTTDLDGAWQLYWWVKDQLDHKLLGSCEKVIMSVMDTRGIKYDMSRGKFFTLLKNEEDMILKYEKPPERIPLTVIVRKENKVDVH